MSDGAAGAGNGAGQERFGATAERTEAEVRAGGESGRRTASGGREETRRGDPVSQTYQPAAQGRNKSPEITFRLA